MADETILQQDELTASTIAAGSKADFHLLVERSATPPTADSDPFRLDLDELNQSLFASTHELTIAAGTVTDSTPVLNLTQTWNDAADTFTALKLNVTDTASAAASKMMQLATATDQFVVTKFGQVQSGDGAATLSNGVPSFTFVGASTSGLRRNSTDKLVIVANGVDTAGASSTEFRLGAAISLAWTTTTGAGNTLDTILLRDAANTLALRNSTAAQAFHLYNTYTSGSVYERGFMRWESNILRIGTEHVGGSVRDVYFYRHTSAMLLLNSNGVTLANGVDLVFNTSTGSKIGSSSTQKLAFWNATPIVQPSSTGETTGFTAGSGTAVNDDSTFTGNVGATAYRISDIVKHLKNAGLIAS